jgi:rfaE bifunctional protein nucleotidyltransferase chain/domain
MVDAKLREVATIEEARAWRDAIAARGGKVVFTNGVFDLLHSGHVAYLDAARAAGDGLIVGLNTDASVRRLGKGPERPINSELDRAYVLLGLKAVDQVVLFDEDTPLELIVALSPHILAKGADYTLEQIVGAKEVLAAGGDVLRSPLREGRSTTAMLRALRQS